MDFEMFLMFLFVAPDVTKNDGVYSGYFFEYNRRGRYSVQVRNRFLVTVGNQFVKSLRGCP